MNPIELRNLDEARRYIVEGLWLQRAVMPTAATVRASLEWAMEVANAGHVLPPVGFVADVGHIALGTDGEHRAKEAVHVLGWRPALGRQYEDYLLGKLYADWTFERAGDALRKYQGKKRIQGLAYVVNQIRARAVEQIGKLQAAEELLGVLLPPAVIRGLLAAHPNDVLSSGWEGLMRDGPSPLMHDLYGHLVAAGRRMSEALGREDVEALEDGSALGDMGPSVAIRQIRQTTARLVAGLPTGTVLPFGGRKEVPTRILDEDQYPVGGYTSISTKGSIESLLHSQLAYIEDAEGPDLFDMKYARDELFYYSRDENQFLRHRRTFVYVLFPDLVAARYKDPELGYQRIVMIQATILALTQKLSDWLSTDAIRFEVVFVQDGERKPLTEEAGLAELLFRVWIERKDGALTHLPDRAAVIKHLNQLSRVAQVHCLAVATEPFELEVENALVTELVVSGPRPQIGDGDGAVAELDGEDAFDVWQETLLRILRLWV